MMTKTGSIHAARNAGKVLAVLAALTLVSACATTDDGHTRDRPPGGVPTP